MLKHSRFIIYLIILLVSCQVKNVDIEPEKGPSHLISDKLFTKQYPFELIWKFVKSYPKNQLTKAQVKYICERCSFENISQMVVLFKAQFESGLIANNDGKYRYQWREDRIMGYGLHKSLIYNGERIYPYKGFTNQIFHAVDSLRGNFDGFKAGDKKRFEDSKLIIYPDNGATKALYDYTPFFKSHTIYGWSLKPVGHVAGNDVFIKYFDKYLSKLNKLRRKTK